MNLVRGMHFRINGNQLSVPVQASNVAFYIESHLLLSHKSSFMLDRSEIRYLLQRVYYMISSLDRISVIHILGCS